MVTFTKEIFNGKLHFLCGVDLHKIFENVKGCHLSSYRLTKKSEFSNPAFEKFINIVPVCKFCLSSSLFHDYSNLNIADWVESFVFNNVHEIFQYSLIINHPTNTPQGGRQVYYLVLLISYLVCQSIWEIGITFVDFKETGNLLILRNIKSELFQRRNYCSILIFHKWICFT